MILSDLVRAAQSTALLFFAPVSGYAGFGLLSIYWIECAIGGFLLASTCPMQATLQVGLLYFASFPNPMRVRHKAVPKLEIELSTDL